MVHPNLKNYLFFNTVLVLQKIEGLLSKAQIFFSHHSLVFQHNPIVKCEPTGGKLKWGTIIPLIGGSSIGCSYSTGNLPAFHLSYTPFKNNEAHLERYWPKVPKYYIDQDQEPENMKGVDYINTCAGLAMLNRSKGAGVGDGSDAKVNKWMFKSAEYVLGRIKPKVMWGENAHMLFTQRP